MSTILRGSSNFDTADSVIETITNVNGIATKFGSGLMICEHTISIPNVSLAHGSIFSSSSSTVWTYPVAFVTTPSVTGNDQGSSVIWTSILSGLTSATVSGKAAVSIGSIRAISLVAIGSWE